jgi:hypothetical protein
MSGRQRSDLKSGVPPCKVNAAGNFPGTAVRTTQAGSQLIQPPFTIMRYLMKIRFPNEAGNAALSDPEFGAKMGKLLKDIKAEAAYFTTIDGQRGGYVVVTMSDASEIPAVAEPFFHWLKADLEFLPVMTPEDLGKAGPAIGAAVKQWG